MGQQETSPSAWRVSLKWIIAMGLSALISYFTSQAKLEVGQARLDERENNHYSEVLRRIDLLSQDIRDLRDQVTSQPRSRYGR
jgi:hypothetical protein